jgi:hypothetical protein
MEVAVESLLEILKKHSGTAVGADWNKVVIEVGAEIAAVQACRTFWGQM